MVNLPPIGIIQGRLTTSLDGRLQFFPKNNWRNEFPLARKIGLQAIEPILESADYAANPLLVGHLLDEMRILSNQNDVAVVSVCADLIMDYPPHRTDRLLWNEISAVFDSLIDSCGYLGVKTILVPVLEKSAINNKEEKDKFRSVMMPILKKAQDKKISIALESSLPAVELIGLLESFEEDNIRVYYDIGNAVSYGYDVPREIIFLDDLIVGVHVKDRKVGSEVSVPLGTGDADFPRIFSALREIGYANPLILQAARDPEDAVCDNARRNLEFVRGAFESA